MWYIYMLECSDGTIYTGITTDVQRRFYEHNNTSKGAKYTARRRPCVLLGFFEVGPSRGVALSEEAVIKKLSPKDKRKLITSASPDVSKYKTLKRKKRRKKRKKK